MHHLFRDSINKHLLTLAERLLTYLETIDTEKLWTDVAPNLSSPGNIVLHVIGNLNQYVLKTYNHQGMLRYHTGLFTGFCKYLFNADFDFDKGRDLNVR